MASDGERRSPGRPPAAPREAVEQIALALMQRDGYDAVSVDAIAAAAGIGRSTFFRYFGTKPGVVWAPFEATLAWLRESLDARAGDGDPLGAVQVAIVESTRAALHSSDVWLERFRLLDAHPSLRAGAYEHWEQWKRILAEHVAAAQSLGPDDAVPMAIAGACHGVFLAELRNPVNTEEDRDVLLERLASDLEVVGEALGRLLGRDRAGRSSAR